jgi:hypothetical protein
MLPRVRRLVAAIVPILPVLVVIVDGGAKRWPGA